MENFSIRAVSLRTGLSPYVIRAWEQRYGTVTPDRTPTGHRRYTADQVRRLEMLAKARAAGHSIGAIASLPLEEIAGLAADLGDPGPPAIADALAALPLLEPATLDAAFEQALRVFGRLEFIDGFLFPFLKAVRRAVEKGTLRPAHLSFAHTRLREVLALAATAIPVRSDAPRVVMASAPGLEHEAGLLGSAIHAASAGWCPIRFGPGTPAEELAFAATSKGARAVVYSIILSSRTSGPIAEATLLRRLTPQTAVVMFGGRLDPASSDTLIGAGLERIPDMRALRDRLAALA